MSRSGGRRSSWQTSRQVSPEPGGFLWDEGLSMLQTVIMRKHVVGFDIVELSCREHDVNSPFAVAKMIYKMIGSKLDRFVFDKNLPWPDSPAGPIFL